MKTMRRLMSFIVVLCLPFAVHAQTREPAITFDIKRATGPITIDGDLSDAAWKDALRVDKWYETNATDNTEPKMKNVAWMTYDDHFFYAAFHFEDPNPEKIRAPFADRDNVSSATDYGGVILDTRNDGKTAILFLSNARGIQYDSVSDDTSGNEDSSPDFFWESSAKITKTGWDLELRIPFSSLRYKKADPQTWGILLYRNYPRDRRYQMFANKLPKGGNCFICNENKITGLTGLPQGGHIVAAPYMTVKEQGSPRNDTLGNRLVNAPAKIDGGIDVKWTPNADTAIDGTLNPDFSQVESDVAAISANQRFAIFFSEKRPFFLEGVELFSTPIQAVYTRTITSPRFGLRSTGKFGDNDYTAIIASDRGGGLVILPGPNGSDFANQDFSSTVAIGRIRHNFGLSYLSLLGTFRESEGGAHNRVLGPDFQWRINDKETVTGQVLVSDTKTPDRPDLAAEWNGQTMKGHAEYVWWTHNTKHIDWYTEAKDYSDRFRADNGFVPQVGYREEFFEGGYTMRPTTGFANRIRLFLNGDYSAATNGDRLFADRSAGIGFDGKFASSTRLRFSVNSVRSGDKVLTRHQLLYSMQFTPSNMFSNIQLSGSAGEDVDFSNTRLGRGVSANVGATIRPTDHLELRYNQSLSWLNVKPLPNQIDADRGRLFTAQVERIRATYTFNSKMFVRGIVQNVRTNRNQELFLNSINQHSGNVTSSLLFAYKLNWQTLLFLGVGDERDVDVDINKLQPASRQLFMKVSYAFQR
ncbi:MAG: carbohydrate binding family 9 domain-containing protein [Acidobacteria bacterium]|nr:carbohydrate binding family 9 domain-containing protein [Acidobacteriota bacterium]MBV9184092.1 carbohydrate binding family 9 domain-containing protein [Acidobacteriota bacterium]